MNVEFKILGRNDENVFTIVAPTLFDNAIDQRLCKEFLNDPRHHIAVAIENDLLIGFISAVHYIHPDKPVELWINELSVAPPYRRRGIAKDLLRTILKVGFELGCKEAWVLTDRSNLTAMRTYSSVGGSEYEKDMTMFTYYFKK